jgi:SAM-dependent methyltransferase
MRDNVKLLVQIVSETFETPDPILEVGSLQVPRQEGFADLRPFFKGKTYIGCDMRVGSGVDIAEDVENLGIRSGTIGTALIVDTLEHVGNPWKALEQISRVLKRNGMVVMTSTMNFPIHDYPGDFWRFTPEAFELLLKDFTVRISGYQGLAQNPHTVFCIGFKSKNTEDSDLSARFEEFCDRFSEDLSKTAKKESTKLRIFRRLANGRFPRLLNPIHSNDFKTVSITCLRNQQSTKVFTTRI